MKRTFVALSLAALAGTSIGNGAETREAVSRGINNLGLKTLKQIQQTEGKEKNLFISAFSLHEALTMAYSGSEAGTRKELAQLLGLDARVSNEDVADIWKSLREELVNADPKVRFDIANSMWGNSDQKVRFVKDFVRLNKVAHDAEIRDMDFQADSFLPAINGWVSEKTQGKIPQILSGPIPEDQLFYLVNAIYFKGAWKVEFDKKLTRDGEFTNRENKKSPVKMMRKFASFPYYADRQLEAVRIPFGKESRYVMGIYLPRENTAQDFLGNLRDTDLARVNAGFRTKEGTVQIPRFKIEYGNEKVVDVLKAMGVHRTFTDDAELPNIAEGEAAKINTIIHKAVIEVNEEGAEAAAATVVGGVRATSVSVDLPFQFEANRPFYFEISDTTTGTTVFSGVLNNPVK